MTDALANTTGAHQVSNPGIPLPTPIPPTIARHPVLATIAFLAVTAASTITGVYAVQPQTVDYSEAINGMGKRLDKLETGLQLRHDRTSDRLTRVEDDVRASRVYHQTRAQADADLFKWQSRVINRVDRLEDKHK